MSAYEQAVTDHRRSKDEYFRGPNSPVPARERAAFEGLGYYPPDEAWRFAVPVERTAEGDVVEVALTTGDTRQMVRYGTVRLALPTGEATLAAYAQPGDERPARLFVPFRDATSGTETYGAGRYVDAPYDGETLVVDFNLAYYPFCAYADGWACPLPPAENWLTVPVTAGERDR